MIGGRKATGLEKTAGLPGQRQSGFFILDPSTICRSYGAGRIDRICKIYFKIQDVILNGSLLINDQRLHLSRSHRVIRTACLGQKKYLCDLSGLKRLVNNRGLLFRAFLTGWLIL